MFALRKGTLNPQTSPSITELLYFRVDWFVVVAEVTAGFRCGGAAHRILHHSLPAFSVKAV